VFPWCQSAWIHGLMATTPGAARTTGSTERLNPSLLLEVGDSTYDAVIERSMMAPKDAVMEAPSVAMAATRARPTMSADAVAAVRRGLRAAFSWLSRPVTPVMCGSGEPMARANPPDTNGASVATPMNVRAAPAPP